MRDARPLPDPQSSLYEARDFIFDSILGRRALEDCSRGLAPFLTDLLDATYRLSQSCHLAEFTDHGVPHLCSLVDRISRWDLSRKGGKAGQPLPQLIAPTRARTLLVATLIHDLGMLSQNPEDLPLAHPASVEPSQWTNFASWVRRTHVMRLPRLLRRVMGSYSRDYERLCNEAEPENLCIAIDVAMAHQQWPWDWAGDWQDDSTNRALAAVVSVADLLDEDSARCDTETLLKHRGGDELNRAHWIRHALTSNRVMIVNGSIRVEFRRPPQTGLVMAPLFAALRNHFRLVLLYAKELAAIGAPILTINLQPSAGIPPDESPRLDRWMEIDGFENEHAITFQLLRTFMPEALKDSRRCDAATLAHLHPASLEDVDRMLLERPEGFKEPRLLAEQTFEAIARTEE